MATTVGELCEWLQRQGWNDPVGVDEGGLTLRCPQTGAYFEVGGLPEPPEEKSSWDEDSEYPMEDWKYEVDNGETLLGYQDWVKDRREQDEEDCVGS